MLKKSLERHSDNATLWIYYLAYVDLLSRRGAFTKDVASIADTAVACVRAPAAAAYGVILSGLAFRTTVESMMTALTNGLKCLGSLLHDDGHGSAQYADLLIRLLCTKCDARLNQDVLEACNGLMLEESQVKASDETDQQEANYSTAWGLGCMVRKVGLLPNHLALVQTAAAAALITGKVPMSIQARLGYEQQIPGLDLSGKFQNISKEVRAVAEQLLFNAAQGCPPEDVNNFAGARTCLLTFLSSFPPDQSTCTSVSSVFDNVTDHAFATLSFSLPSNILGHLLHTNKYIVSKVGHPIYSWRRVRGSLTRASSYGRESSVPHARGVGEIAKEALEDITQGREGSSLRYLHDSFKTVITPMLKALSTYDVYPDTSSNAAYEFEEAMPDPKLLPPGYEKPIRRELMEYFTARVAAGKISIEHCLEKLENLFVGQKLKPLTHFADVEGDSRLQCATQDALFHEGVHSSGSPIQADVLDDLLTHPLPQRGQRAVQLSFIERLADIHPSADLVCKALQADDKDRGITIALHILGMSRSRGIPFSVWSAVASQLSCSSSKAELWRVATTYLPHSADAWYVYTLSLYFASHRYLYPAIHAEKRSRRW